MITHITTDLAATKRVIREYLPKDFMPINVTTRNKWTQFPKTTNHQNSTKVKHNLNDSMTLEPLKKWNLSLKTS